MQTKNEIFFQAFMFLLSNYNNQRAKIFKLHFPAKQLKKQFICSCQVIHEN